MPSSDGDSAAPVQTWLKVATPPDPHQIAWRQLGGSLCAKWLKSVLLLGLLAVALAVLASLAGLFLFFLSVSTELRFTSETYYKCFDGEKFDAPTIFSEYERFLEEFQSSHLLLSFQELFEDYMSKMRLFHCYCASLDDFPPELPNAFLPRCRNSRRLEVFGSYARVLGVPVFLFLLFLQKASVFAVFARLPFANRARVQSLRTLALLGVLCFNFSVGG